MTATIDAAPDYTFRKGRRSDAPALAEFGNMAGEGLPLYLWGRMAGEGESAWEVGCRRAAREDGAFSYRNATVFDAGGEAVACLIGYAISPEPEPIDAATTPPVFVPLLELESLAPGTWYVNVLAVEPAHRGQGLGTRLIGFAEEKAREARCPGLSIIVSDVNAGARRLYNRCGYRERARRVMVKEDWINPGREWVLLTK